MAEVTENDIRLRFAEVDDLLGRHETAIAYLKQERAELEAAIRVFERFHQRPEFSADLLPPKEVPLTPEVRKPPGIPSMPEMILTVLATAQVLFGRGLEPKAIADEIRIRWWPDAPLTSVGPIAWRMAKEGRLKKIGAVYALPELETPALPGAGASEPQDGSGIPNLL